MEKGLLPTDLILRHNMVDNCQHDWLLFFRDRKAWLRCAFCGKEKLHPLEEGKEIKEGICHSKQANQRRS